MFVALNVNFFGIKNSDFKKATKNLSAVIPLYVMNPSAAKGTAPKIHTQETVSNPKIWL